MAAAASNNTADLRITRIGIGTKKTRDALVVIALLLPANYELLKRIDFVRSFSKNVREQLAPHRTSLAPHH